MRRATLLVGDRNPRFLEKTGEILAEAGHSMISVTDGKVAQGKLTQQLDGLLIHAALPGLSGFALCRLAKERDPTLPVVIMFSAEDPRGEVEAKRAGADNWLVRPLKRLELLYVVRDLIGLRSTFMRAARTAEERDQAVNDAGSATISPDGSRLIQFELFKRLLGIELKRSQRYGFPLSILVAGLDKEPASGDRDVLAAATRWRSATSTSRSRSPSPTCWWSCPTPTSTARAWSRTASARRSARSRTAATRRR